MEWVTACVPSEKLRNIAKNPRKMVFLDNHVQIFTKSKNEALAREEIFFYVFIKKRIFQKIEKMNFFQFLPPNSTVVEYGQKL